MILFYLLGLALIFLVFVGFFVWRGFTHKLYLRKALNYRLLLVSLPRYSLIPEFKEERRGVKEEISIFENFLNSLASLKEPVIFEFGVPHGDRKIYFYLAVPQKAVNYVKRTITGLWPGSEVILLDKDYNPFVPEGTTVAAEVFLEKPQVFPIRTYTEITESNRDPLEAFLGAKFASDKDGLVYQVIVWPEEKKWVKKIQEMIREVKEGKLTEKDIKRKEEVGSFKLFLRTLKEVLWQTLKGTTAGEDKKKEESKDGLSQKNEELVSLLQKKISKPLFWVNIRMAGSSEIPFVAEDIIRNLEAGLSQFLHPQGNSFNIKKIPTKAQKRFIFKLSFRIPEEKKAILLNSEEIASIFHFPTSFIKSPLVHFLQMRIAPAPRELPQEGGVVLGKVFYPGDERKAVLTREDRRRHLYVIGQTGTGKTNFLKYLAVQDLQNGDGLAFIDPHGDLAQELLGLIPEERIQDVIYFSPGEVEYVLGLNILEYDPNYPYQKTFLVNALLEILGKLYDLKLVGGPLFEQYLRNGLLLLMEFPEKGYTLLDFPRVMVDDNFREKLLQECKNPVVLEFWRKEAKLATGELSMQNITTWVTSKLNPFLANDFVRPIIAQPRSSLDFNEIMNSGKIFIANLSKGLLGETSAYLLGMMLVAKFLMATFKRAEIPQDQRRDFYLFVDEFQNFAFDSVASILSEARKYRLSLHMAHQYVKQLPEQLASAVVGNVGTLIVFRIGPEDAKFFEQTFSPTFTAIDLQSLPNFHAYIRLLISGVPAEPFAIKTIKAPDEDLERAERVRRISLQKWGRKREEVEKEIEERYKEFLEASSAPPETPTFGIGF